MKKKKERDFQRSTPRGFSTSATKREIRVYDNNDTSTFIDRKRRMTLADLNFELPNESPTKVLSLRLPTSLLNRIKAYAGEHDVPYSAMIKMLLVEGMESKHRNVSRAGRR